MNWPTSTYVSECPSSIPLWLARVRFLFFFFFPPLWNFAPAPLSLHNTFFFASRSLLRRWLLFSKAFRAMALRKIHRSPPFFYLSMGGPVFCCCRSCGWMESGFFSCTVTLGLAVCSTSIVVCMSLSLGRRRRCCCL